MLSDFPLPFTSVAKAFDHSSDCLKVLDPMGHLIWINKGGLCAMEIQNSEVILGAEWCSLWPKESRDRIRATYRDNADKMTRLTAFCPTAARTPKWWEVTVVPLDGEDGARCGFLVTSRDVTERVIASRSRDILLEEMRHRQGNTLSLASTLMSVHARDRPEVSGFVEEMSKRLAAIGRAQSVIARPAGTTEPGEIDVENLLRVLVSPLIGPKCELVLDVEPGIVLDSEKLDAVGMVISELAVNSAKHGAFCHGGRLALSVVRTKDGTEFCWQERCDHPVSKTVRNGGQGQRLMERIASVHDGVFEIEWRPSGQLATLLLRGPQSHANVA